jgi:2-polyprenyl-6-methoxyphenol hydroxylase-like FAD-dependent oxidoreductase
MQKWLKALRLLGLAVLIVLAVLGVGLSGAMAALQVRRRPDDPVVKIELVERKKEERKDVKFLSITKR